MIASWWICVVSMLIFLFVAAENSDFCIERGYSESRIGLGTRACVAVVNGTHIVVERDALR